MSVLFADIVSFTPLAQQEHPESLRLLLAEYYASSKAIIERYGGTAEKFIGDAVMAVWGSTLATPDDPERAVRAALELASAAAGSGRPLTLRIGVATGMAAVPTVRSVDNLAAGDVVTLASRVQTAAPAGKVWVDMTTHDATSDAVHYIDRGFHSLKGRAHPERLHEADAIIAERGGRGRPEVLHVPLAGYRGEFATIRETLNATVEEKRGRLLIVTGDAGTGKSRLGLELQNYADGIEGGVRWHWTRCASLGGVTPYAALASAVRGRLGIIEGEARTAADRLNSHLAEFVEDANRRAWLRSAISALLGFGGSDMSKEDLFAAWSAWFASLSQHGDAVVWVVDDAHEADDSLLEFVQHLVATAAVPLMVVLLARPELLTTRPDLASRRGTTSIRIDGLGSAAMNELLDRLIEGLPEGARAELAERAGNVPLFAMETVRGMMDRGEVEDRDGMRFLVSPTFTSLPTATLTTLITGRLDLLDTGDRRVLLEASVLDSSFTAAEVAALSGGDLAGVTESFHRLAHRDLITPSRSTFSSDFGRYSFVHAMVRQVAYETLSRQDRARLHFSAASVLSNAPDGDETHSGIIVEHLMLAKELGVGDTPEGPNLCDWLMRAAERSTATGGFAEALRNLELALASAADDEVRNEIHVLAAECCMYLRRFDDVFLHTAAVITHEASLLLRNALTLTRTFEHLGRLDDARSVLNEWQERPDGIDDKLAARWACTWAFLLNLSGEGEQKMQPWAALAVEIAERTGNPVLLHQSVNIFGIWTSLAGLGRITDMVHREAVKIARDAGMRDGLAISLNNFAISAISQGDVVRAIECANESVTIFATTNIAQLAIAGDLLVRCLTLAGQLEEAAERVRWLGNLLGVANDDSAAEMAPLAQSTATLQLIRGLPVDQEMLQFYRRLYDAETDTTLKLLFAGALACHSADPFDKESRALARWLAKEDLNRFGAEGENVHQYWPAAVRLSIRAGEFAEARAMVNEFPDPGIGMPTFLLRTTMACARWMLEIADPSSEADETDVERGMMETLEILGRQGFVIEHARGSAFLAVLLERQGRLNEAHEVRAACRATLTRIGAMGVLAELGLTP